MSESRSQQLNRWSFRFLLVGVSAATFGLLLLSPWYVPSGTETVYWNALVAFLLLGIACDSSFLPLSRIAFARVGTSVAFIPFIASVLLFAHPWPMVLAGATGVVADAIVR